MTDFADTQSMGLEEHPSIDAALDEFRKHIKEYRKVSNDEGVWLFLSTLGCWSVTSPILQLAAFAVALIIFSKRLKNRIKEKKSFPKSEEIIRQRIHEESVGKEVLQRRLARLENIRGAYRIGMRPIFDNGVFAICWLFYGASVVLHMMH
ncbi:hypothetical protein [Hydrogenophaga electricum]|uniref:hypothetical protein n=1 Tax=Hydrogenophaga electricum TaxID=1230953 RepID=UPI0024E184CD|nr:hypothetical protein [Hydrogenophaga electricum]